MNSLLYNSAADTHTHTQINRVFIIYIRTQHNLSMKSQLNNIYLSARFVYFCIASVKEPGVVEH